MQKVKVKELLSDPPGGAWKANLRFGFDIYATPEPVCVILFTSYLFVRAKYVGEIRTNGTIL